MLVKRRFVSAVFLVKIGELPFDQLLNRNNREKMIHRFAFDPSVEIIQGPSQVPAINLKNGIFETDDGQVAFPRMHIEPRKLILDLEGHSKEARSAYQSAVSVLAALADDVNENFLEPVLVAMETSMISNLDFSVNTLISDKLIDAVSRCIEDSKEHTSIEGRANPAVVTFDIDYITSDFELSDYRIGLSRKQLTIGPLRGYPLSDQIYDSKAPLDTYKHERFLQSLEDSLS